MRAVCYNPALDYGTFPSEGAYKGPIRIQGEFLQLFRPFSALALALLCAFLALPSAATKAQTTAPQPNQGTATPNNKPTPPKDNKDSKTSFTAEQVVESVILVYGSRPALEHIRRNGVERGKVTRFTPEGNPEESNYERRFVRGESLDKDKIRLDQKLSTMEYSLIYGDGKLWGLINGAAFTPRQDAANIFLSQHIHSIEALLRYKESGSTITLNGKEQQKGLELFVVELLDKEKRKTRYYVSARTLRILWLEYEDGAVKYTRKFMDYRPVQQTLVPYHIILLEDGRQSLETRVLTIIYGTKVDDSIFKNPEA